MNDHELDALLRASAPITDADVAELPLGHATADLRAEIVALPDIEPATPAHAHTMPRTVRSRRLPFLRAGPRRAVLVGCVLAAIAIGAGVGINGRLAGGPATAWSAEAVRFAESSPRLLVQGDEYRVVRANQWPDYAEIGLEPVKPVPGAGRFEDGVELMSMGLDGGAEGRVFAYDPSLMQERLAAADAAGAIEVGEIQFRDRPARLFRLGDTTAYRLLWTDDDYLLETHATASTREALGRLVDELATNIQPGSLTPKQEIQMSWYRASEYETRLSGLVGPNTGLTDLGTTNALGRPARWFKYDGFDRFRAVFMHANKTVEIDGVTAGKDAFADFLSRLVTVDTDTWLRAMPESVVKPDSRDATIEAMLKDIPLPPKFQLTKDGPADAVNDRYQLGAAVTGQVTCAWIGEWVLAKRSGDAKRQEAAAAAMATARQWAILKEMVAEGAWSEVVWEYADVMNGRLTSVPSGGADLAGVLTINGQKVAVPRELGDPQAALGCR